MAIDLSESMKSIFSLLVVIGSQSESALETEDNRLQKDFPSGGSGSQKSLRYYAGTSDRIPSHKRKLSEFARACFMIICGLVPVFTACSTSAGSKVMVNSSHNISSESSASFCVPLVDRDITEFLLWSMKEWPEYSFQRSEEAALNYLPPQGSLIVWDPAFEEADAFALAILCDYFRVQYDLAPNDGKRGLWRYALRLYSHHLEELVRVGNSRDPEKTSFVINACQSCQKIRDELDSHLQ